jgi:hypothetical protein
MNQSDVDDAIRELNKYRTERGLTPLGAAGFALITGAAVGAVFGVAAILTLQVVLAIWLTP